MSPARCRSESPNRIGMRRIFLFRSFRVKVTLLLILVLCFSGAVSNFLIYRYSMKSQFNQLREKLMIIAQAVSMSLDTETLLRIPLSKEGENSPEYKAVGKKLLQIKEVAPSLAYIYVLKKTRNDGILQFVIDVHPGAYKTAVAPAYPGEHYYGYSYPELMKGFAGPSADKIMVTDKWGVFLSGYAPIRDKEGNAIAILGIDMSADDVYQSQKEVRRRIIYLFLAVLALSLFLGMLISARVAAPIKKLVQGTRYISSGDLQYRVSVGGSDEIAELADSFNSMASNLYKARQSLVGYFYRVVQSLVRVLEARDPYTKGHSDRVAGYSQKIAREMGLPEEKIELLKEAALLHDIGKLGVQEMVLNKKAAITDEDREIIRKHPAIGEEILRPVSPDKEMLAVVRGHHERYDGKGYPDRLSGDNIDALAVIVAAADSYDAMTSNRPYRKNLNKEEAMEQLKSNSGCQFNPKVVEAFLKVLEREGVC